MQNKNMLMMVVVSCFLFFDCCIAISEEASLKGFVYLHDVDPTILVSLRYYGNENFVGTPVDAYKNPVVMMTRQAAEALKKVQAHVKKDGYCLVVYDAYRPQQAVNHFMRWSKDCLCQSTKELYYPRVEKEKSFELGYIAERSGHSRGSTVDITLIKDGESVHVIEKKKRALRDGYVITFLDDGTIDMGSSFDLFDEASHYENNLIEQSFKDRREYLKVVMEQYGFKNYANEWWHFTLVNEPYPRDQDSSYFNFEIE